MSENQKKINLLGIVGSPRRGGNTDCLVDEVLTGADGSGVETDKVYLSKLNISPCRACEACKKNKRCVVKDDMQELLDKMEKSDIWVLGTPVYFWGPTGWFKAFMDRLYGARQHIKFKDKKAVLVVPFEDTNMATSRHTVGMLRDTLDYLKMNLFAEVVVPGVLHKGDVNSHQLVLDCARNVGQSVVKNFAENGKK